MTVQQYFSLIDIQARMALRADASRFFLGYLWWVLEPLLYVAVFYVVFDIILDSKRSDFLLFLIVGKLPFMWFSGSVNTAANSIVGAHGLIGQLDITKSVFPMAKVQEGLYKQAAVFLLMFLFVGAAGHVPHAGWLWLLPLALAQYALIVACSLAGAVLVCYARDFSKLIALSMIFLMFVSGIFWDVRALESQAMTDLILAVNPLAFILDGYRQVLLYQAPLDVVNLAGVLVGCTGAAAAVLLWMSTKEQELAIRVLAE